MRLHIQFQGLRTTVYPFIYSCDANRIFTNATEKTYETLIAY